MRSEAAAVDEALPHGARTNRLTRKIRLALASLSVHASRGNADDTGVRRHVAEHDRSGTDRAGIADAQARKHAAADAEETVGADRR